MIKKTGNNQSGFTLIELLVVIAIFMIIASVLLFNYGRFNSSVSVTNLSQDVALSIRKAQSYATSVRTADFGGYSTSAYPAYGISFTVGNAFDVAKPNIPSPKGYVLFADVNQKNTSGYRVYQPGNGGGTVCGKPDVAAAKECAEIFTIASNDTIQNICIPSGVCYTASSGGSVNIIFHRPTPDADICVPLGSGCGPALSYAKIGLVSAQGIQRSVTVWNTGQISIN